ncbi:MAG TPA: hypothetical protein G4O18_04740 [Dehalococcoidia bacterium]|nr:hypothetical protein [Dehalococcoidia bacterium]
MTIVSGIHISLDKRQVLRREGIRQQSSVKPEIMALIDELLASTYDKHLLEPAIAYDVYAISEVGHDSVQLDNSTEIRSASLSSLISGGRELTVAVCTIGPKLEKQVTDYLGGREPLRGLLLDGIGSAAVDSLVQETCRLMQNEASLRGYQSSSPISPGIPGFPITEQWPLFQLVPSEEIGVRLAPSGIMVPRKSASMVIALGEQVTVRKQGEACARCNLSKTCHYRLVAK